MRISTRSASVTCGPEDDPLGQVQQALVAQEALVAHVEARQAAPVEVEEAHVVEDDAAPDAGAQQAQPGARAGEAPGPGGRATMASVMTPKRAARPPADLAAAFTAAAAARRAASAAEREELPEVADGIAQAAHGGGLVVAAHVGAPGPPDAQAAPRGAHHELGVPEPARVLDGVEHGRSALPAEELVAGLGVAERRPAAAGGPARSSRGS